MAGLASKGSDADVGRKNAQIAEQPEGWYQFAGTNSLPPNKVDLTGQKFGKLTVLSRLQDVQKTAKNGELRTYDKYRVECECGTVKDGVDGNNLRSGNSKTCGCGRGRKRR